MKLKNGLSVGVISTVFLYVCGFLWQYAYLGIITDHIGWIKVFSTDYIYLGVMALIFTLNSCAVEPPELKLVVFTISALP